MTDEIPGIIIFINKLPAYRSQETFTKTYRANEIKDRNVGIRLLVKRLARNSGTVLIREAIYCFE